MVFSAALAVVTIIAPPAAVVTGPMAAGMIGGAAGGAVTAGTVGVAAAGATAGAVAGSVGTVAGATGGLIAAVNVAIGPPGWIVLGADLDTQGHYKWDCWKPVIHDFHSDSKEGMPLAQVLSHSSVINVTTPDPSDFGSFVITNEWREQFKVYFVKLQDGQIAAHAAKIQIF